MSPLGLRLPEGTQVEQPSLARGLVEIQDEGSQLVCLACEAAPGMLVGRPVRRRRRQDAGARRRHGESRAGSSPATPTAAGSRACRRGSRAPASRSSRPRLLDPGREPEALADLAGAADLVLVDAPCSGSGTWRRNPETRWRITPERLDRLTALQARLLDIGADLLKPGGALVYAVCSLLAEEGRDQAEALAAPFIAGSGAARLSRPGRPPGPGCCSARPVTAPTAFSSRAGAGHAKRRADRRMEYLMRLTPIALSLAIAAATMASAGNGQRPDDQIDPRSAALVEQARARERRRPPQRGDRPARDRARRRSAATAPPISRSAASPRRSGCPARRCAIMPTRCRLEPNDVNALAGQGEAYRPARRGRARARATSQRVQTLCRQPCPQAQQLAAVIQRGPPAEVLAAQRPEQGAPDRSAGAAAELRTVSDSHSFLAKKVTVTHFAFAQTGGYVDVFR